MIIDKISNWQSYAGLANGIMQGLEFLNSGQLEALTVGKHEIDGEKLYASVQEYYPKSPSECRWEAHRAYIDLQYVVSGFEAIGYCPLEALKATGPYDVRKDIVFFNGGIEAGTGLKVVSNMFAIFYPQDAHMPMMDWNAFANIKPSGWQSPVLVKKIVLKVAVEN